MLSIASNAKNMPFHISTPKKLLNILTEAGPAEPKTNLPQIGEGLKHIADGGKKANL